MKILEHRIPPPLVMVLFAALMWAVSRVAYGFDMNRTVQVSLIGILLVLGAFFALSGMRLFRKASTTVNPLKPETASALVTTGIYKVTRNPMYVGLAFLLLAWAMYLTSFLALLLVPGFVVYINYLQIIPEERALREIFGDAFTEYCAKVRRWV